MLLAELLLAGCARAPSLPLVPTSTTSSAPPATTGDAPAAGDLDPSFGNGGVVLTNPTYAQPSVLAIQTDGRIVLAGAAPSEPSPQQNSSGMILDRYDLDGSRDSSFPKRRDASDPASPTMGVGAVAIQADGKIVVAGTVRNDAPGWDDFALARYDANGSLDTSFGADGVTSTDLSGGNDWAQAVAFQTDGKIIVGGRTTGAPQHPDTLALARYTPDGRLDRTFGTDGIVFVEMNRYGDARAVAIQPDGKIVVVGGGNSQVRMFDFAILRFDASGELDSTFGHSGIVLTDLGGSAIAMAVGLEPDGKIVISGYAISHLTMPFIKNLISSESSWLVRYLR